MPSLHAWAPRRPPSGAARTFQRTLLSFSSSCASYRHRDPGRRPRRPNAPRTARRPAETERVAARAGTHIVGPPRHAPRHTEHADGNPPPGTDATRLLSLCFFAFAAHPIDPRRKRPRKPRFCEQKPHHTLLASQTPVRVHTLARHEKRKQKKTKKQTTHSTAPTTL